MNKPRFIILHHSGVSYMDNPAQWVGIDNYHRSKGWGGIGYHYLIEKNGEVKPGRAENMDGAHCYQENMNVQSIGLCLSGNFDKEEPTIQQIRSLSNLISVLQKKYSISDMNILPHSRFAPKTCWGKLLPKISDEIRKYIKKRMEQNPDIKITADCAEGVSWVKSIGLMTNWNEPQAGVSDEKLQWVLVKLGGLQEVSPHVLTNEQLAKALLTLHKKGILNPIKI